VSRLRTTPRAGADRWLVSYADFTTLLLAFFMALYAVSDVNPAKLEMAAASMREAFDATPQPRLAGAPVPAPPAKAEAPAPEAHDGVLPGARATAIARVRERLRAELADAIAAGQLELGADERGLVLSLPESATFPVATADVTPAATAVIDRIAATIGTIDVAVRVEGHTDDTPIKTTRYASNWELSTARASAVVARFIDQHVDPTRLSAAGYGEFHPRADNVTAEGRASNRRVDVVMTPQGPAPVAADRAAEGTAGD
jgi:chemotaxis protein MotB